MRHTIVFILFASVVSILACGSQSDGDCTEPGGTCVTPQSGLTCGETLPYPCSAQNAVCCIVKSK
jgi:hypothetical protein